MTLILLKKKVTQNFTERPRQGIRSLKVSTNWVLTKICARIFDVLPISLAASIKESVQLTGRLDYPHRNIYMDIASSVQVGRLQACSKEPETVEWLETCMRPGDVLYDIGANVGAYSFVACAVADNNCKIYAFEPSFATFAALSQNIFLNHCHNKIVPLHVALSNKTQLFTFNYSSVVPGAALHDLEDPYALHELSQFAFSQPILSYRLDDLVHQFGLQLPNHIKLDVDGAELSVLQGAEETLTSPSLRSLLVEVDEEHDASGELLGYLEGKGFGVRSRYRRPDHTTVANFIFERNH